MATCGFGWLTEPSNPTSLSGYVRLGTKTSSGQLSRSACRSVRDGLSPAGTLDEANGCPAGSANTPSPSSLVAPRPSVRRRVGNTLDDDVEVHLLRDGRVRPGRRTMVRSELKREPRGRVISRDDREIVACMGDRVAQERRVEPRECSRVRTVEDDVVQASVHALNGLSRRPQLPRSARTSQRSEARHTAAFRRCGRPDLLERKSAFQGYARDTEVPMCESRDLTCESV
jgi:hypothetical protein